jgi:ribosomal protein S8E
MLIAIVSGALRRLAGVEAAREDEKSKKKLEETKQKFVREMGKHPLLRRIGPEKIWDDLQKHIQDQIRRRNKAAGDDDERRLQEIKREFVESIKRSLSLSSFDAEKIWNNIQDDIRAEIRLRPGEWRSV